MALDGDQVRDFARSYTEAWCSGDPTRVAGHFAPGGTIAINGGPPTEITEVASSFMSTFPDLHLLMDNLVVKDGLVEFHWTCVGTNTDLVGPETGSGSPASRSGRSARTDSLPSRRATTTRPTTSASSNTAHHEPQ